jgi:hypothetical protein
MKDAVAVYFVTLISFWIGFGCGFWVGRAPKE